MVSRVSTVVDIWLLEMGLYFRLRNVDLTSFFPCLTDLKYHLKLKYYWKIAEFEYGSMHSLKCLISRTVQWY